MKTEKDYEEKAKELVEKFRIEVIIDTTMDSIPIQIRGKMNIESAKQCALICVQEVREINWIDVKDRLPDARGEYIVCGKGLKGKLVSTLNFIEGKWWSDVFNGFIDSKKITHWMPLPEPPKRELNIQL